MVSILAYYVLLLIGDNYFIHYTELVIYNTTIITLCLYMTNSFTWLQKGRYLIELIKINSIINIAFNSYNYIAYYINHSTISVNITIIAKFIIFIVILLSLLNYLTFWANSRSLPKSRIYKSGRYLLLSRPKYKTHLWAIILFKPYSKSYLINNYLYYYCSPLSRSCLPLWGSR